MYRWAAGTCLAMMIMGTAQSQSFSNARDSIWRSETQKPGITSIHQGQVPGHWIIQFADHYVECYDNMLGCQTGLGEWHPLPTTKEKPTRNGQPGEMLFSEDLQTVWVFAGTAWVEMK